MSGATLARQVHLGNLAGQSRINDPGVGGTFDMEGRGDCYVVVSATGTYTLPSVSAGDRLLVIADDTSVITLNDTGSNTVAVFTGTTNKTACLCTSTSSTTWVAEVMPSTSTADITANSVTISDGGTVTQATSKATGVTLSTNSGQITMNGAALAAGVEVSFAVTNTVVAATDVVVAIHSSGGTAGSYLVQANTMAAGSFAVTVSNVSAGSLSEAIVINFIVFGGSAT